MHEARSAQPEMQNFITILAEALGKGPLSDFLRSHEPVIFSMIIIAAISSIAYLATRRMSAIPGRLQAAAELLAGSLDEFICGILGPRGRTFTPFIGTLFVYILAMNLSGLIPMMKSSTSSWSTTLSLALCVFFYLQYTAIKDLGFFGYIYHMLGRPKGILAASIVVPMLMLFIEIIAQLVRPISLSLRLRSNIWGDDMLLAVLAGFGLKGVGLLLFSMFLAILASLVQASVFCLLTTIYFVLALEHEDA